VKPFELLGQTVIPDGTPLKLVRRSDEYLILADTAVLMTSRMHGSEELLASLACQRAKSLPRPSVLIGGLGMGFTLRATLDLLPPGATVTVAELIPAVVDWNRGPLAPLAAHPLDDKRVHLEITDVAASIRSHAGHFDAILLDVDNGPAAFTVADNSNLYDDRGIAAVREALKPGGVLSVWAIHDDTKFQHRLRHAGFEVHVHRVRARSNKRGPRHIIFLALKP